MSRAVRYPVGRPALEGYSLSEPILTITFVLPRTGEWPSGGLRVVYQYATHLAQNGHIVTVVHPGRLAIERRLVDSAKNFLRYAIYNLSGRFRPNRWMTVHPRVALVCVPSLAEKHIPEADVVIATAWQTAEYVTCYSQVKGMKFYLIQHLETWNGPQARVTATWKAPLQKIVVSGWLADVATSLGESAIQVKNGLDANAFKRVVPTEDRNPNILMMLYHTAVWKGSEDGLKALELVREHRPQIRTILYGVSKRPAKLPAWIEYHQSPSPARLLGLYNQAAIFVAPSRTEGWGLPACEALLCGASLVATDIDGHREFAFHEKTALVCPSGSPDLIASSVIRLMENRELRLRLARQGHEFVRQLTWERSTSKLEHILKEALSVRNDQVHCHPY